VTLRCASCGRVLRAYTVTVTTAAGVRGYGPVCGAAIYPSIGMYKPVYANKAIHRQAAPIIRNYSGRDNIIQDGQMMLALEFA
jgi:hypothetical protein